MARRIKSQPRARYNKQRMKDFETVAGKIKKWRSAHEVLDEVRSVQTIFPQVNAGTRVGGWPLQRICLAHGPSNHGKTMFALGLGLSFLKAEHFYGFVDAEKTTPKPWVKKLMGEWIKHPGFLMYEPRTYEETRDQVRTLVETVADAREKGELPKSTGTLVVVDSIKKLMPKRLFDKLNKIAADSKKGSIDGMSGAGGMYKAALNSAWMDELTPLMHSTNSTILLIGREAENLELANLHSPKWKLTGGKGIVYDSSLIIRVTREKWLKKRGKENEIGGTQVIGEQHCASIHKTKIGGKDNVVTNCYFHTSNGAIIPEGFDRARDVIDLAKRCRLVVTKGGYLVSRTTGETWQGENEAVKSLTQDPISLYTLEQEVIETCRPEVLEVEDSEDNDD